MTRQSMMNQALLKQAMSKRAPVPVEETSAGRKKWIIASTVILLMAMAATAWWYFRPDPQIAAIREMGRKMMAGGLNEEERRDLGRRMRDQFRDLSEDQRRVLYDDGRKRREAELDKFFSLSKEERIAHLDAEIDRVEAWRKKRQEERAKSPKKEDRPKGQRGNGRGGSGRGSMDANQRKQAARARLDSTPASSRAKTIEYSRMLSQRMQERGLGGGRGGGPGGGWGGRPFGRG